MKTRSTKNADATRDAVRRVAQIADAQHRITEILTAAAAKVRLLEEAMHEHGERIETAVSGERPDASRVEGNLDCAVGGIELDALDKQLDQTRLLPRREGLPHVVEFGERRRHVGGLDSLGLQLAHALVDLGHPPFGNGSLFIEVGEDRRGTLLIHGRGCSASNLCLNPPQPPLDGTSFGLEPSDYLICLVPGRIERVGKQPGVALNAADLVDERGLNLDGGQRTAWTRRPSAFRGVCAGVIAITAVPAHSERV